MSKRFEGRVILVTGAARGIGRATASAFATEGAAVALADRDGAQAEVAAGEIAAATGARAIALPVDVADVDAVGAMVRQVIDRLGRIDVLVNNAGITRDATLLKTAEQAWQSVIDVNLSGTFHVARAVAPHFIERGSGVILNASSIVAFNGNFGQSNYVASKAGVIGLTRVWARELGRKGVRVNCIAPGFIATDMTAGMPQEVLTTMKSKTPLGRLGTPEDVARAYVFLASDDAAFINGQVLGVDGGLVIGD